MDLQKGVSAAQELQNALKNKLRGLRPINHLLSFTVIFKKFDQI
jgi:hypothetical protein